VAGESTGERESQADHWTAWRVEHRWPEHDIEITSARHPYACGLESLVHENKGCYLGQEVLTRMRSRGKTGWALVQGSVDDFAPEMITSQSKGQALAIVRTRDLQ
jgi:folate-binding protein YgfZ